MIARTVTLRALVLEDIARTAFRCGDESAARLLRRADVGGDDFIAVERDLSRSGLREARVAGDALSLLHLPRAAATRLAMWCGLDLGEWVDEACCEQGVVIDDTRVTT